VYAGGAGGGGETFRDAAAVAVAAITSVTPSVIIP
jgi:hypothetical protein